MAFKDQPQASGNNNGSANDKKVLGFLNLYMPTHGGDRKKLGSVYLNATNAVERKVFEALRDGGEAKLAEVIGKLQFTFAENTGSDASDLDI